MSNNEQVPEANYQLTWTIEVKNPNVQRFKQVDQVVTPCSRLGLFDTVLLSGKLQKIAVEMLIARNAYNSSQRYRLTWCVAILGTAARWGEQLDNIGPADLLRNTVNFAKLQAKVIERLALNGVFAEKLNA